MVRTYTYNHKVEDVFNLIVNESLKAFKKEKMSKNNLLGLTVKSKIKNQVGQEVSVVQKVIEYKENELYSIETTSPKDTYTTIYKVTAKGDKTVLEYEEKYKSTSTLRNFNQIVMGIVYYRKIRKRTLFIFKQIEVNLDNK